MLSTPDRQVSLRGLEGVFSSNPTVETITVSDAEGVWLEIEGVEAVWIRMALLRRMLDIDSLTARQITVLRKPLRRRGEVDGGAAAGAPPVDIIVDAFNLPSITLAPPVIGADAQLSAEGGCASRPTCWRRASRSCGTTARAGSRPTSASSRTTTC